MYFLRELANFDEVPAEFKGDIEEAFDIAKLTNMNHEDWHAYEMSLKYYRDFINVIDNAKDEGREESIKQGIKIGIELGVEKGIEVGIGKGIEKGLEQAAISMLKANLSIEFISEVTELSEQIILRLKLENNF